MIKPDAVKASNLLMEKKNIRRCVLNNIYEDEWIVDIACWRNKLFKQNVMTNSFKTLLEVNDFLNNG